MPLLYTDTVLFFLTASVESSRVESDLQDTGKSYISCIPECTVWVQVIIVSEWDSIPVDWLDSASVPVG
jgi:hypothetical protein